MFINEINKTTKSATSKPKKSSSGSDFASYLGKSSSSGSVAVNSTSAVSINNVVLAAQYASEEEENKKKEFLIKRGKDLLSKLVSIRDGLFSGYISMDKLVSISRFVKEQKVVVEDDILNEIIAEIELRVEVELAKLMK